jgi:hypothetical protein
MVMQPDAFCKPFYSERRVLSIGEILCNLRNQQAGSNRHPLRENHRTGEQCSPVRIRAKRLEG